MSVCIIQKNKRNANAHILRDPINQLNSQTRLFGSEKKKEKQQQQQPKKKKKKLGANFKKRIFLHFVCGEMLFSFFTTTTVLLFNQICTE